MTKNLIVLAVVLTITLSVFGQALAWTVKVTNRTGKDLNFQLFLQTWPGIGASEQKIQGWRDIPHNQTVIYDLKKELSKERLGRTLVNKCISTICVGFSEAYKRDDQCFTCMGLNPTPIGADHPSCCWNLHYVVYFNEQTGFTIKKNK